MQFYVLERRSPAWFDQVDESEVAWTYDTLFAKSEPIRHGKPSQCSKCGQYTTLPPWLPPYHAHIKAMSGHFGDIALLDQQNLLVSERFRRAWTEAGLRGIDRFTPATGLTLKPWPSWAGEIDYHHVATPTSATMIDHTQSDVTYLRPVSCDHCKTSDVDTVHGFAIAQETWTGEDLFFPRDLYGIIVVSDRFRAMCSEYSLTNINLIPTECYCCDPFQRRMATMNFEIRGVHAVQGHVGTYLVDMAMDGPFGVVDWSRFLQSETGDDWLVVFDEQELESLPDGRVRVVFFCYDVDSTRPLFTRTGPIIVPEPTPLPAELAHIPLEAPCLAIGIKATA